MGKHILLLTATVTPLAGTPALARLDPAARLNDYLQALEFYTALLGRALDGIVFAENSASNVDALKRHVDACGAGAAVEFISCHGLDYPASHGRGYGEFKLVDHAMKVSKLISGVGQGVIWKCTGRYVIRNLAELAAHRPPVDLYCHCRDYPYRLCELLLMSFSARGYAQVIEGVYRQLRNDIRSGTHSNEEALFRAVIDQATPRVSIGRRFNRVPEIDGIRAWNNTPYRPRGPHAKLMLRRAAHVVAPWLWI